MTEIKNRNRLIHRSGILSLLGGITAVGLIVAFSRTSWGMPGSDAYRTYELLNRLMAGSLLLVSAGWLGLVIAWPDGYGRWAAIVALVGSLTMVIGNSAEFWLFSDLSYAGSNMRQTAYSTFSIGDWLLILGATVAGAAAWRSRIGPRWSAITLLLAVPIEFAAFFFLDTIFLGAAVLALAVGNILLTKKYFPAVNEVAASWQKDKIDEN